MAKSNYLLKAEVIENGLYDAFCYIRQTQNSHYYHYPISEKNPYKTLEDANAWEEQISRIYPSEWKECERLYHAKNQRVKRLKEKLGYMVKKGDCCFLTLTFTDEVLARTSASTRHDYVKRFLQKNFRTAIGNLDFGAKNGREHYHAVVLAESVKHDTWKYGALKSKRVKRSDVNCADKLAHYTSKLVNHAIKETTKGSRTIYSGFFGFKPVDHVQKWRDCDCDYFIRYSENFEPEFEPETFVDCSGAMVQELMGLFPDDFGRSGK